MRNTILMATLFVSLMVNAQNDSIVDFELEETIEEIKVEFFSLCYEETLPVWTACDADSVGDLIKCTEECILQFIESYLKIPKEVEVFEGSSIVSFVISKEGAVEDVQVFKGCHELLDLEAVKVISQMPNFIPATHRNRPVKVKYYVPVRFKIT